MADPILIVGPGAIGLLHAARLRAAGLDVTLLDHRPDRVQRLKQILLAEDGRAQPISITATADPAVAARHPYILICVKAHATASLARTLAPHVVPATAVLSLQNGLGNLEALAPLCCQPQLRRGVTSYGARLLADNTVSLTGIGTTQIAAPPADTVAAQWKHFLEKAGFVVLLPRDPDAMLWHKLVLNAALNPVTARFGLRNGQLPGHPQAWAQACAILDESIRIAKGCGISLDSAAAQQQLREICQNTAANTSSMLVDLQQGRATEIAQINGALVQAATLRGMPAPHNSQVIAQIRHAQMQPPPR